MSLTAAVIPVLRLKLMGETMKKLTTYTAVLASVIYLVGCGGGSSSSTSASTDSKTNFYIANQTGKEFAKVEVYYDGAQSQEQKTLLCGASSECVLGLDANNAANNFTLKFFNDASNLVAAYNYIKSIDDDNYLLVNDATLGLYIYKEVKSKYDWTDDVLTRRVSWFFGQVSSPDKINDDNEELGIYYLQQTADNKLSHDQFLASLNKSLENHDVYGGGSQLLVKSAAAPKLSLKSVGPINCPAATEKFGGFIQKIANVIPYPPVQKALSGAVSAIDSGCGTRVGNTIGNVRKDLADIKAKLDEVKKELLAVGLEISQWREMALWNDANAAYNELLNQSAELHTLNNVYRNFLITNNSQNLVEYFKTHELTKDSINSNASLKKIFDGLSQANVSLTILEGTKSLQTISASLRGICSNADNTTGDILSMRDKCNIFAAEVISQHLSEWSATVAMVRDIAQTLAVNKKQGIIANPFGTAVWYSSNESENTVFTLMGNRLTDALNKVSSDMDGALVGSFEGLDTNLQARLIDSNCAVSAINTGGKLPAILAWEGRRGTTKFVITECRSPDDNRPVVGRYDYEGFDNTAGIANAFGAIVDKKIFSDNYYPPAGYFGIELNASLVPFYLRVSGGTLIQNNLPLSMQKKQTLIRNDDNQSLNWPKVAYIDLYVEPGLYKTQFNGTSPGYGTLMGSQYTEKHQTFIDVWMSVVHDYQLPCIQCMTNPPHKVDKKLGCLHRGCTATNQAGLNGEIRFNRYQFDPKNPIKNTLISVKGDDKNNTISLEIKNVAP